MWTVKHHRAWVLAAVSVLGLMGAGCDNNIKTENEALKAQNTELQNQLTQTREELDRANADRAALTDRVAKSQVDTLSQPAPGKSVVGSSRGGTGFESDVDATSGPRGVTVRLPGDVLFDSGRATIKPSAQKSLNSVASTIRSKYAGSTLYVEGYTDSDPIRKSTWGSNEALSKARADAVRKYLAAQGVRNPIVTEGKGSSNPRSTKALSRRVEIVIAK